MTSPKRSARGGERCVNCLKQDWRWAVDNYGERYRGCANCVVQLPAVPVQGAGEKP